MRTTQLFITLFFAGLLGVLAVSGLSDAPLWAHPLRQTTPTLTVASGLTVQPGAAVAVPLRFASNGASIGAISFALDFDQACLTYTSATFALPANFVGSVTPDLNDSAGELEVVLFALPVTALPPTLDPLLTLTFTALTGVNCPLGTTTPIAFAVTPAPSFGTTAGGSLAGTTTDGNVTIGSAAPTNTPTNTPLAPTGTATNTPTNTPLSPTGTATNTPTNTPLSPTGTATNTPTNTPLSPTGTATNTPTNTPLSPTGTATNTPTNTPATATPVPATAIVLSSAKNGTARGLHYRDEDIIQFNPANGQWTLVFDGSDVGLSDEDVDAFLFYQGVILLSVNDDFKLSANHTVNSQTLKVDAADLLAFVPTQLGNITQGKFERFLAGASVGLDSSGENIDALALDEQGKLLISVTGGFKAGNIKGDDEDLFAWDATAQSWSLYFDGSRVGLTQSGEDVRAAWVDHSRQQIYLGTHDDYRVPGASGSEDDIFICTYTTLGADTACTFAPFFDGKAFGFAEAIDGLFIGVVPLPITATAAEVDSPDNTLVYPGDDADTPDEFDGNETDAEEALDNYLFLPLVKR